MIVIILSLWETFLSIQVKDFKNVVKPKKKIKSHGNPRDFCRKMGGETGTFTGKPEKYL
jgi:hypothetical protein